MRNNREVRQMIKRGYKICCDSLRGLSPFRGFLTNPITRSVYMEKSVSKRSGRTFLEVKSRQYWEENPIRASLHRIPLNILWLSRRVTILRAKGKWNYNNFCTLERSVSPSLISQSCALRLLQIKS